MFSMRDVCVRLTLPGCACHVTGSAEFPLVCPIAFGISWGSQAPSTWMTKPVRFSARRAKQTRMVQKLLSTTTPSMQLLANPVLHIHNSTVPSLR
mmetsp:Transcript_103436/g.183756  ORF Transcript_103436/g.183756 Transcript_103436/m.183756 type:complete len:95 (+) Transcript_103436:214-498(+)